MRLEKLLEVFRDLTAAVIEVLKDCHQGILHSLKSFFKVCAICLTRRVFYHRGDNTAVKVFMEAVFNALYRYEKLVYPLGL